MAGKQQREWCLCRVFSLPLADVYASTPWRRVVLQKNKLHMLAKRNKMFHNHRNYHCPESEMPPQWLSVFLAFRPSVLVLSTSSSPRTGQSWSPPMLPAGWCWSCLRTLFHIMQYYWFNARNISTRCSCVCLCLQLIPAVEVSYS